MKRQLVVAMLVALIGVVVASEMAQEQKPIRSETTYADYDVPPPSIDAMTERATAVAVVKFTGETATDEEETAAPDYLELFTVYKLEIVSILKNHFQLPLPGGQFQIKVIGGRKEYTNYIREVLNTAFEPLKLNHKYVVFLKWHEATNSYVVPWGPLGFYDITEGKVVPLSGSVVAVRYHGMDARDFIERARAKKP